MSLPLEPVVNSILDVSGSRVGGRWSVHVIGIDVDTTCKDSEIR